MKKTLVCLLACAALALAAPCDSQALSDAQHKQFKKISEDYRAADAELNRVWRQLKGKLSAAEFRTLLKDQREWIATRREVEAKALIAQSIPEVDAYTATITSRVRELSERLGKLGSKPAKAAKAATGSPAVTKPAPEAKPTAPARPMPALIITRPADTKAPVKAEIVPESKTEAVAPAKPAEEAKPARPEIGLPFLEEEPAAKPETKPAVKSAVKPGQPPRLKDAPK